MRAWEPRDVAPYRRIIADREVMRHMGSGAAYAAKRAAASALARVSDLEARRDIAQLIEHWKRGYGEWAVESKESGELIGRIGFKHHADFTADPARIEIGWLLARDAWGHGYATEAAALALAEGFDDFGLERVISISFPGNHRSLAVMERLGLTIQGRTRWHGSEVLWGAIDRA